MSDKPRMTKERFKVHFYNVAGNGALCGASVNPVHFVERITNVPEQVTCAFCRKFNLKARARAYG